MYRFATSRPHEFLTKYSLMQYFKTGQVRNRAKRSPIAVVVVAVFFFGSLKAPKQPLL